MENNRAWNKYSRMVESGILRLRPDLAGKLEWNDIKYMYYGKVPAKEAVKKYLETLSKV